MPSAHTLGVPIPSESPVYFRGAEAPSGAERMRLTECQRRAIDHVVSQPFPVRGYKRIAVKVVDV